ncbi:MAG: argininosuccinate lyase, partial [Clostridiales bacterium]|nr:argininosuccinate lyase [Clostridiales bacterium]
GCRQHRGDGQLDPARPGRGGADGRLHTARSRNDIGLAQYRIGVREHLLKALQALEALLDVLLAFADEHKADLMPAYTHTQPAQPTTLGHYILAAYDALSRDAKRILAGYHDANRSPLGAAAITTTGFAIDRFYPAEVMGFEDIIENSYDCIAGADYLSGSAGALASLSLTLSRLLKDTLDYCTVEFGVFRLADPYVQTSSIMPQKRNPSSLEHARPIASRALGEALTVLQMLHNTPMTDMVDSEEDLQPTFYRACDDLVKVMDLLRVNYATLSVNTEHLKKRAGAAFITATELADTLVRDFDLSFRESHHLTAQLVRHLSGAEGQESQNITAQSLSDMARETIGRPLSLTAEYLQKALDPANFVAIRGITGGPALEEMLRMIASRADEPRHSKAILQQLQTAENRLQEDVLSLLGS